MSTREFAYSILDSLSDKQVEAFVSLFEPLAEIPNEETLAAMEECEKMLADPNTKTYTSLDELFEELDKDE